MNSINDAPTMDFYIPAMPKPGKHHVISKGQTPDFYRPDDLRDIGQGKTLWVDSFEKTLVGMYWLTGKPVSYAFRTPDGKIRSLDAGCIKMLLNRTPPELLIHCDPSGYINSIQPAQIMLDRYEKIKTRLTAQIADALPEPI